MKGLPLGSRKLSVVAAISLLLSGCMGSYVVTRELRGSSGPQKLYYIYPPGSRPTHRVRVVEPLASKPDAACAAKVAKSPEFTMRFRGSSVLSPAIVVKDKGKLPASRQAFDEDVAALIKDAGDCLPDKKAPLVTARLWERMPKTFAQDLYDRYGFDLEGRRVDLQPGMRLRFEWQAYVTEPPSYIGGGTSFMTVGRRPHGVSDAIQEAGLLTFEPFLSWMAPGKVDRTAEPQIAGVLDLEGNRLWRKYYRLYLPRKGFGPSSEAPTELTHSRTLLVGVNDVRDFATVEKKLKDVCNKEPDDSTRPVCTSVAGRTLVVPEIPLYLRGSQSFVPLGTTLRHVIDREAKVWSLDSDLPLRRDYHGRLIAVVFLWPDDDALDLPLVKGDHFSW